MTYDQSGEASNYPTRYSTALVMWLEYGEQLPIGVHDVNQLRLVTGLAFRLYQVAFESEYEGRTLAAVVGSDEELQQQEDGPLVRLHSGCIFSELGENQRIYEWLEEGVLDYSDGPSLGASPSKDCDCRSQRRTAQALIAKQGGIYFDLCEQEGRGAGIEVKREAYRLHREEGLDNVEAYKRLGVPLDTREYAHCARFLLNTLGLSRVKLMSNNPRKIAAFTDQGIEVTAVPLVVGVTPENVDYLRVKRDKANHSFPSEL